MITQSNSYLSSLCDAGADTYGNLYAVDFTFHENSPNAINNAELSNHLTVRTNGFTPPEVNHESYEVKFINTKIPRPAAKVKVTHEFSLEIRVDANYDVYKALLSQQSVTFNAKRSYTATDIIALKDSLFDVNVRVINQSITDENTGDTQDMFKFEYCWISSIDPLQFDYNSTDPQTVKVTCKYLFGNDLQSMNEL